MGLTLLDDGTYIDDNGNITTASGSLVTAASKSAPTPPQPQTAPTPSAFATGLQGYGSGKAPTPNQDITALSAVLTPENMAKSKELATLLGGTSDPEKLKTTLAILAGNPGTSDTAKLLKTLISGGGGGGGGGRASDYLDANKVYEEARTAIEQGNTQAKANLASTREGLKDQRAVAGGDTTQQAPGSRPGLNATANFMANLSAVIAGLLGTQGSKDAANSTRNVADAMASRPYLDALKRDEFYAAPIGLSKEAQEALTDKTMARKKEFDAQNRDLDRLLAELDLRSATLDADTAKSLANLKAGLAEKAAGIDAQLESSRISAGASAFAAKVGALASILGQENSNNNAKLAAAVSLMNNDRLSQQMGVQLFGQLLSAAIKQQGTAGKMNIEFLKTLPPDQQRALFATMAPDEANRLMIELGKAGGK